MTQPESGMQLIADRYAVRSLIGRGGSGAVWRGEDLHLGRPVAITQIVLSESLDAVKAAHGGVSLNEIFVAHVGIPAAAAPKT